MENQMIKRIMIKTLELCIFIYSNNELTLQEKKNSFHSDYKQRQI